VGGAVVVVVLVLLEEAAREEEPADELVLEFVNENGAGGALGTKASPRITSKRTSTQQQTTEPQKDRIIVRSNGLLGTRTTRAGTSNSWRVRASLWLVTQTCGKSLGLLACFQSDSMQWYSAEGVPGKEA